VPAIAAFGSYLPEQVLANEDLTQRLGISADWIAQASGIQERRIASETETTVFMGAAAARRCLTNANINPNQIGLILVSSGSSERRFPGPAVEIAYELRVAGIPCLDLPLASAGALVGIILASRLVSSYGPVLVIATEKMSSVTLRDPLDKNTAILFGDGAGACLLTAETSGFNIIDSAWHSDGQFVEALQLPLDGPLRMDGLSVILQASRKIPAVIAEVLDRNNITAGQLRGVIMHQANQNLIQRVAKALALDTSRFFSNIARYGNTSSASMLIAADEYLSSNPPNTGELFCFAAFGAGFQWGSLLTRWN
jgi:3-oxoacyl-[acyl-carrier-protein] synthase-3